MTSIEIENDQNLYLKIKDMNNFKQKFKYEKRNLRTNKTSFYLFYLSHKNSDGNSVVKCVSMILSGEENNASIKT